MSVSCAVRIDNHVHFPDLHLSAELGESAYPKAEYVTQPQTHFDESNGETWEQAFYVNDTFWTPGSDAPVFLCCGGEGPPIDGSAVQHSVHCNVAVEFLQETKALMFAVEHRYYGTLHNHFTIYMSNTIEICHTPTNEGKWLVSDPYVSNRLPQFFRVSIQHQEWHDKKRSTQVPQFS